MESEERICRLCLNNSEITCKQIMEESKREIQNVLLLKIDLTMTNDPGICKNCSETIQNAINFKSTCLYTQECVDVFTKNQGNIEVDLKDVYLSKTEDTANFSEGYKVCRFCMKLIGPGNFISLDNEEKMVTLIEILLAKYFPELNFSIIKEPVACTPCAKFLENYFNFITTCLEVEENIKKFCEAEGIDTENRVKLSNVLHYVSENNRKNSGSSLNKIKTEEYPQDEEIVDEKVAIKTEDVLYSVEQNVDVKSEEMFIKTDQHGTDRFENGQLHENTSEQEMYKNAACPHEASNEEHFEYNLLPRSKSLEVVDSEYFKSHRTHEKGKVSSTNNMYAHNSEHENNRSPRGIGGKKTSKEKVHKCETCAYRTDRKHNLLQHMVVHKDASDVTIYTCDKCTFQTKRKESLSRHTVVHKSLSELTIYKCKLCEYKGKRRDYLQVHMQTHESILEVTMYKCGWCSYRTRHMGSLNRHERIHKSTTEKIMYSCEICTYTTDRKDGLQQHKAIHHIASELKMYKCDLCVYESRYKSTLKRHMLIHKDSSDVTMYQCEVCKYQTKRKGNLQAHIVIHRNTLKVTSC